ncbi:MAG: 5-(carboxyamino)imidazole ribonucleotide mutase [Pseudomonadota bacterium]
MTAPIAIWMGSESDLDIMQAAADACAEFGVAVEMTVVSAHRTPDRMFEFARAARGSGIKVIIAGAGGAAHLPGMVAAMTTVPVIGVPVGNTRLSGLDSLLSIVQMPRGVPVATVAIDNARNAGLLALQILAVADAGLARQLDEFRETQREAAMAMAGRVERPNRD